MAVPLQQYSNHVRAFQRALATGQRALARRELLLASRVAMKLAAETVDPNLRESRKRKSMRMFELASSFADTAEGGRSSNDLASTRRHESTVPATTDAGPQQPNRWQLTETPGIFFADIAGLDAVKNLIRTRVILPFRDPDLAGRYRRRPGGGILMYGPPGTGKTMMAKGIATELGAPFFSVQCSDVMSKWVGEAEQNLKELFETARAQLPAVIFLDETEALISKRGGQSTVMNRLIPEFLSQVDGLKDGPSGLLLLGATNRPWDLDPAALRHGRFGEHVYVGLPDAPARQHILESALRQIPREEDVDLGETTSRTEGYSGADLCGLVDRIVDPAFEHAMETGLPTPVRREDVEQALLETRPSVSSRDLARYEKFRREGV